MKRKERKLTGKKKSFLKRWQSDIWCSKLATQTSLESIFRPELRIDKIIYAKHLLLLLWLNNQKQCLELSPDRPGSPASVLSCTTAQCTVSFQNLYFSSSDSDSAVKAKTLGKTQGRMKWEAGPTAGPTAGQLSYQVCHLPFSTWSLSVGIKSCLSRRKAKW